MEIEKITNNKIKVTVTPDELREHDITPQAVKENAPCVHRLIMDIMRRAEESFGFSPHNARLMVEASGSEDGTMTMYITRLEPTDDLSEAIRSTRRSLRLKVRPKEDVKAPAVITFDSVEDAISLAKFLGRQNGGQLYFYNGCYHIVLRGKMPSRVSDFGRTGDSNAAGLVCEHGKKISDNAFETLRKYF